MPGDTYPNKTTIKVGGVPIDITGWDVNLRYKLDDGTIRVVDCVVVDPPEGKVLIYPHDRGVDDAPITERITDQMVEDGHAGPSNQCWKEVDAGKQYEFSIVRKKKFGNYEEVMTHASGGYVIINKRV